ncbi:MAG: PQQ-binding-like beta-propeller repeat protein [Myxococcales bacterium]|nr:PQQ-binding-like beta-propeller repeat protein [Myxococcales bacterium]
MALGLCFVFAASCGDGGDTTLKPADGDCRQATWACADGWICLDQGDDNWQCVPEEQEDLSSGGTPDTSEILDFSAEPDESSVDTSGTDDFGPDSSGSSLDVFDSSSQPDSQVDPDFGGPDLGSADIVMELDFSETDTAEELDITEPPTDMGSPEEDIADPVEPLAVSLVLSKTVLSGLSQIGAKTTGGKGVLGVEFQVDGITMSTDVIPPYSLLINTALFKDGPHELAVFTADTAGSEASAVKTVVFDNTPPKFEDLLPAKNATIFFEDGPMKMMAKVNDAGSIAKVTFRANGLLVGEFTVPPFEVDVEQKNLFVNESQLPKNIYLQYRAEDTLGQSTEVAHNVEIHKRFLWEFPTLGEIWGGASALPNGNIVFGALNNTVTCVNPNTGKQVWQFPTAGSVSLAPTVDPTTGRIFFGTLDGKLYCLDSNGSQQWLKELGSPLAGQVALSGDHVVAVAYSGNVQLYAKSNGANGWGLKLPAFISAPPTVSPDGMVFVGCQDGSMYALTSGVVSWSKKTANEIWSGAAVSDIGVVYFGSNDGWLYAQKKGGQDLWSREIKGQIWGRPLWANDNTVYVASTSKYVHKLDAIDGTPIWQKKLEGITYSSPVIDASDTLYIGTTDGILFALDAETGNSRFQFLAKDTIHATPLIVGDRLFIGSTDRSMYAMWRYGVSLVTPE